MHNNRKKLVRSLTAMLLALAMALPLTACQVEIPGVGTININDGASDGDTAKTNGGEPGAYDDSLDLLRQELDERQQDERFAVAYIGDINGSLNDLAIPLRDWINDTAPGLCAQYTFVRNIPQERVVGDSGSLFCVVPRDPDATLAVNRIRWNPQNEDYDNLEVLYRSESGDPILLYACADMGESPYPDTEVIVTDSTGKTVTWYPIYGITALPYDYEYDLPLGYSFTVCDEDYGGDMIGNEVGAAAKNVVGIAAGFLDGVEMSSLKGALMSRGTREVARLIKAMGGNELSAYGLCHLGDYEATVFSPYSHNRQFGESFIRHQDYHRLAEGYYTVEALMVLREKYGVELRRTLTGFKFIGEQIGKLEAEGHVERYIFGFEESYGYLSGGHVRDKDAVNATLLVCEAAAWYAQQGMTLLDAIEALYKEFGYYRNALCSFAFEGETGMYTMQNLMKTLRADPPKEIAGYAVERVADYDTDGTGLPRANVLEYHLAGGHKLMVRPSGTEPKIKVYLSAVAPTEEAADAINDTLGKAAAALLKA